MLSLPYNSGTTGVTKGVELTHRNLAAQMEQLDHPEVKLVDMKHVTVCVLPLYHIFAGKALIDLFDKGAPNVRFREGYGMAEMSPAVTFTRLQVEQTGGSCGQLLPNTNMKVLDLVTEEEKGPGETGELCLLWWDWFQLVSFLFKKIRHKVDLVKNTNSSFLRIGGPIQFWSLYRNAIKFYSEGIDTNNTLVRTVTGEMDK